MKEKIFNPKNLINVAVICIIFYPILFDKIYYQTNDDRGIELISNGVLYQSPSSELIYVSKLIGILLSGLYSFDINISWYLISILITQLLSIYLYLNLIKNLNPNLIFSLISMLPLIIFYGIFFSIQYTQTALLAAAMGTLSILFEKRKVNLILAGILIFLGVSWRPNAAFVGIALVFGIIGVYELKALITKRFIVTLGISATSLLLFLSFFNSWAPWLAPEKRTFVEFNSARESVQGYGPTELTGEHLRKLSKKIGWSRNDYRLSQEKSYSYDPEIYSTSAYLFLEKNKQISPIYRHYFESIKNLFLILKNDYLFLVAMFMAGILVVTFQIKKVEISKLIVFTVGILTLFYAILLMGKLPERLVWPIGFVALASFIFITFHKSDKSIKTLSASTLIVIFLIFFASMNFYQRLMEQENWWKTSAQEQFLGVERLLGYQSDKPIVAFPSFYNYIWNTSSPLVDSKNAPDIWHKMIPIGWLNQSPDMNHYLKELGIEEDLFTSIAKGDAYLAVGNIEELQMVDQYLREHRNLEVNWPVSSFVFNDSGFEIWRVEE